MLWPSVWCRQSTVPYSDGKYYAAQIHLCSHGGPGQGDYLLCRGWNGFSGGAEPAEVSNHYIHLDSHSCVWRNRCICFPCIILFIGTCRIAEVSDHQIHFHLVLVYCIFHLQSHSYANIKFMLWINTFAFIIAILFPSIENFLIFPLTALWLHKLGFWKFTNAKSYQIYTRMEKYCKLTNALSSQQTHKVLDILVFRIQTIVTKEIPPVCKIYS